MKVRAMVSFCGLVSMAVGQEKDLPQGEVLEDLLQVGYVVPLETEPVKTEAKPAPAETEQAETEESKPETEQAEAKESKAEKTKGKKAEKGSDGK